MATFTGTSGDDYFPGTAENDIADGLGGHDDLEGGDGSDQLFGGGGGDYLIGGAGDDLLDGGNGFDRVSFLGAPNGITVDLRIQGTAQDTGWGLDTFVGIEHVSGTRFDDVLTGNGDDNWLWSGAALDTGSSGNDVISGRGGNDLIEVGPGNHTLSGGEGTDTLSLRGNGLDITPVGVTFSLALQATQQDSEQGLMTATGFENLSGSNYDDLLIGDSGDNILLGDAGNDTLRGGQGADTLYGDGSMDVETDGTGTSGPITLYPDVTPDGQAGGSDTLIGGQGADILHGGRGNDTLFGGADNDLFVIEAASGNDRITDFTDGDLVVFDPSSGVTDFSQLTFTATPNGTLVTWGTSDSILMKGVAPEELSSADFQFGAAAAAAALLTAALPHQEAAGLSAPHLFAHPEYLL